MSQNGSKTSFKVGDYVGVRGIDGTYQVVAKSDYKMECTHMHTGEIHHAHTLEIMRSDIDTSLIVVTITERDARDVNDPEQMKTAGKCCRLEN